jgi:hypothetical protein
MNEDEEDSVQADASEPSERVVPESAGARYFEFDIASALSEKIYEFLGTVAAAELSDENVGALRALPGVYVVFESSTPVYVGKTDRSVRGRLMKHRRLLSGCQRINLSTLTFKTAYFASTWNPFKPEEYLIERFGTKSNGWNGKGFGPNDPGKNRADTVYKDAHFFKLHPIDPNFLCTGLRTGEVHAYELLKAIKKKVPFWFRFQGLKILGKQGEGSRDQQKRAQAELKRQSIVVPSDNMTAKQLLLLIARSLPKGWQATVTPSHMLLYREKKEYQQGEIIWPLRRRPSQPA